MENLIIVRGGGDLATGTIHKLYRCGFPVLVLETPRPSAIRRNVAFCEAIYQGSQRVEEVSCTLAHTLSQAETLLRQGQLPILVDPKGDAIAALKPLAVVDAILAKKKSGNPPGNGPHHRGPGAGF